MASKKYKLLLTGVFILLGLGSFAQQGTYTVFDSGVIATKHMAQQNEFWNNTYDFPAKPRNMWEIGVGVGTTTVSGDVPSTLLSPGFALHLRKALGYVMSVRLEGFYGQAKGQAWQGTLNYGKNTPWVALGYKPGVDRVFYNFKSNLWDFQLQGLFNLNNILFHKAKSNLSLYAGVGGGMSMYSTSINALDANGKPYTTQFNAIALSQQTYANRRDVIKTLKDNMDKTYETKAQRNSNRSNSGDYTMRPSMSIIGGVAFKLSKRVNIALEDKLTIVHDDLLDGVQYGPYPTGDEALTSNNDVFNFASLNFNYNIGNKKRAVEPLWWINPLNYAYSEINNPKHMKLPKPVLDDTDNDGVIDQLDREPNTPAGCPVDAHGVSRDTDGDGVPDCKDKELITPTMCQPVNADGVGKCPDPECCKNRVADSSMNGAGACKVGDLPSISFKGNVSSLSADSKSMLATAASKLKQNPGCSLTVTGYPAASKASQAVCNKRVAAIKTYLVEKQGISADRVVTNCEVGGGDANTVDLKGTSK
jgi:outer membrane protein OmpA-like peptidoglycan-associated protein